MPGCGFYAIPQAAASATGWGEAITAVFLSGRVLMHVSAGMAPEVALASGLGSMYRTVTNPQGKGATGGLIVLTNEAAVWGFTTPRMARGAWFQGGEPWVAV